MTAKTPVPVVTTSAADIAIDRIDDWWRANRLASPNLFRAELLQLLALVAYSPEMGKKYKRRGIPDLRRCLLRATRIHVYYVFDGAQVIVVGAADAVRRKGPNLKAP